ncbi:MAG: hypothetical protein KA243_05420 [Candidatus Aminicenantes bacterium]|nr:hypothetical protein [Candidatus Aminicenantes bacterium]NLH75603.1 hypothetical protein [Acidobacteriota bacterium]
MNARAVFVLLVVATFAAAASAAPGAAQGPPAKVPRWESNLSLGAVSSGRIGIVKSFWWYAVPRIVTVGLSLDHVLEAIPVSLTLAVNAPTPIVVPFVCAGAGTTLTVGGISFYGGGLKIRLGRRLGIIAECRRYAFRQTDGAFEPTYTKATARYFGAGLAWIY